MSTAVVRETWEVLDVERTEDKAKADEDGGGQKEKEVWRPLRYASTGIVFKRVSDGKVVLFVWDMLSLSPRSTTKRLVPGKRWKYRVRAGPSPPEEAQRTPFLVGGLNPCAIE
jgi:hypothetical protein